MLSSTSRNQRRIRPLTHKSALAPEAAVQATPERAPPGADALQALVLKSLDDDKAADIVAIDLRDKSSVTDVMVIASGRSHRHVGALADHLLRAFKDAGFGRVRVEGLNTCDWVLLDAGDIVVHLFRPEVREFYNLEKMWRAETVAERQMA